MSELEYNMTGSCNICLGAGAGIDITDESFQFAFTTSWDSPEYRTEMTPEEYEVVNKVIRRALENKIERKMVCRNQRRA